MTASTPPSFPSFEDRGATLSALLDIYSALVREFVIEAPNCPIADDFTLTAESVQEAAAWFQQVDAQIQVHQLRQFLQTTPLANEAVLRNLLLHHIQKETKSTSDRDKTDIEDAFDICLGYDRLLAWCRSSMVACDASPRFLLHGTAGSFKKYGLDPQEPVLVSGGKVPRIGEPGDWLPEDAKHWGTLSVAPVLADPGTLVVNKVETIPGDYREFYANVRDAVAGKAELAVPSAAGFEVVRLLELARVSSNEGRTVKV